ncbi:MAG: LysR substrate-binding domain-containing protein [Acetobacteraceae bacterium]|nr:LysR substrate-binding domain-containing protein [Acetobacteraceae bacterium]
MDHRQVEIFRTVIDQGSVTAAARLLGVSQPAVSLSLAKLEKRLGFTLFRREGRRIVPTEEARLLHMEASRLLDGFDRLGVAIGEISAGQRGTLTIATNPGPAISWLPAVAAAFRRDRPQVLLRLLTRSSAEVRALARVSAFDLGLAEAPFANAEPVLRRYTLARVAVLPCDHRLAAHDVLTPALLDGEDLVATVRSSWSWSNVARAFDMAGSVCRVVAECEFTAIALNMVAAGAGVCLADPISASTVGPGLVRRPFRPQLPYEVGLLGPPDGELTILARAFADALDAHIAPFLVES